MIYVKSQRELKTGHERENLFSFKGNEKRMVESFSGEIDQGKQRLSSARLQDLRHPYQRCRRHQEMNLLRFIFLLCVALLLIVEQPAFSGKIYKWVDERGVVHFSDQEPDSNKVKGKLEEREYKDPYSVQPAKDTIIKETTRNPIEYVTNCTFTIKGPKRIGSGFLISSGGYALTCKHVVEDVSNLTALLNDQQEAQLNLIFTSSKYDLALVQVMVPKKMPYLTIRDAEGLAPGDRLFAVGASAGLQSTVTDGVFTAFRTIEAANGNFIQFSAPLNPGNSGGPLVDETGRVVGVVSLKFLSQQGMPVSGVGFAVPSSQIKEEYGNYLEK
jgi:S1-C subfamily serine protease